MHCLFRLLISVTICSNAYKYLILVFIFIFTRGFTMGICSSKKINYRNSLEWITAFITCLLLLAVFHTFVLGRHFIIPTIILTLTILLGNLSAYAFIGKLWAKRTIFWLYFIFASHLFFALFWAKKYREILDQAFIPTFLVTFLLFAFLLIKYKKNNSLFIRDKLS